MDPRDATARGKLRTWVNSQWKFRPARVSSQRKSTLKVGETKPNRFGRRIEELVAGHATLEIIAKALLAAHEVLLRELNGFEKRVRAMAREDKRVRLLMSAPGVGPIVGLTYVAAIDDPGRFKSSKQVGPHFGLTPKKYQSGEKDVSGRISKIGDASVRTALYEAANIILTRPLKGASMLKSWGMKLAKRAGMKKAKVALARKLAVILHRMWVDGTPFAGEPGRRCQACGRIRGDETRVFGRVETPAFPKRSPLAGTMDEVRPQIAPWRQRPRAIRLAGLILI